MMRTSTRIAAAVGALVFAVSWGGGAGGQASAASTSMPASMSMPMPALPPLSIVSPVEDAHIRSPVAVIIQTTGDLSKLTMRPNMNMNMSGMGPAVHLHIKVDNTLLMPVASQFVKVGMDRYRYSLGPLSAGTHMIEAYWADNKTHKPVGPIHSVTCVVVQ